MINKKYLEYIDKLCIIAAVDKNGVIGQNGKIPWSYKQDIRWFKEMTIGDVVIMGRKTFESLSAPLKGRVNLIITKDYKNYINEMNGDSEENFSWVSFFPSINEAIGYAAMLELKRVTFIGGEAIYKEALEIVNEIWITHIPEETIGDSLVYFPSIDYNVWRETKVACLNNEEDGPPNLFVSKYERSANVV